MVGMLRVCTSGSVDDGKSTLVGRLLYDSRALYEDQVATVRALSRAGTGGGLDFALFTDGLRAEREQGITIDVAYRYFQTKRRKFVLADTPGHDQYTRNMATGASTSDLAILLADATQGLRPQSVRHARIASLFGIRDFVVAVNKMDLVGFSHDRFGAVEREFVETLAGSSVRVIPVCATDGDNIVYASSRMPWYTGETLLSTLEGADPRRPGVQAPFRLSVQLAIRVEGGFRGYAGRIASGRVRVGDRVTIWPAGGETTIARIVAGRADVTEAAAPASVTLTLSGEHDVARGNVIGTGAVRVVRRFSASVVWMDERRLDPERRYLLRLGSQRVNVRLAGPPLELNAIGVVEPTGRESFVLNADPGVEGRAGFIIIDPATGATAGAGVIAPLAAPAPIGVIGRGLSFLKSGFARSLERAGASDNLGLLP